MKLAALPIPFVMILAALISVAGCTHTPSLRDAKANATCRNMDWFEAGRVDGEVGAPKAKLVIFREQCDQSENPVRPDLYLNGREAGLIDFCTGAGGFDAGKNGTGYAKVCPENTEAAFLKNYELGQKVRILESENAELAARIENLNQLLLPSLRGGSVHAQIEQLEDRRAKNEGVISTLEDRIGL